MSYQVKKTVTSIVTGILVLAAYCIYAFGRVHPGASAPDNLKFWAITILIFIGIEIAASIVIQIVFHVLFSVSIAVKRKIQDEKCEDKEIERKIKAEMVEDEMDKLIELKSMRLAFLVAGIGFIAALVSLALNYSPAVMLNILFISFAAGSLFDGFAQLYYYRRGLKNG
jgi:hypothetical protein